METAKVNDTYRCRTFKRVDFYRQQALRFQFKYVNKLDTDKYLKGANNTSNLPQRTFN